MKLHHYGILLLTLLLLGVLLGYSFVKGELVPIARVGSDLITLREVRENMEVLELLVAHPELLPEADRAVIAGAQSAELFERTFEASIVNSITAQASSREARHRAREIADRYVAAAGERNFAAFTRQGYGWSASKFRERILEPQALHEVLIDEKGEAYEEWLKEAGQAATVRVWFVPYRWENGELIPE
jgi:hypothetical protein